MQLLKYTLASDESNRIAAVQYVVKMTKLELLYEWFSEQEEASVDTWYQLTVRSFKS